MSVGAQGNSKDDSGGESADKIVGCRNGMSRQSVINDKSIGSDWMEH